MQHKVMLPQELNEKIEEFKKLDITDTQSICNKIIEFKEIDLLAPVRDKVSNKILKFSVQNSFTNYRAQSIFDKEPETIEWIREFKDKSIFYDIGANVGVYTIFCALIKNIDCFAFEPNALNFESLVKNINLNKLTDKVFAYPIGLSDITEFTTLYINNLTTGSSGHCVGKPYDHNLQLSKFDIKQQVLSIKIDDLIEKWNFPIPNYLKIDVDNIENKVVKGASKLIKNKKLKSVLIEINPQRKIDLEILNFFSANGFKFNKDQVRRATRNEGWNKGYANHIFYREKE